MSDVTIKCNACTAINSSNTKYCTNCGYEFQKEFPDEKYDAFISYRRSGGAELAWLIKLMGEKHFERKLFLDVCGLGRGRFDANIKKAIENSRNLVLILSPGALDKCSMDGDWILNEVVLAKNLGKNIIQVFKDGFVYPDNLSKELTGLAMTQGVKYNHEDSFGSIRKIFSYFTSEDVEPTDMGEDVSKAEAREDENQEVDSLSSHVSAKRETLASFEEFLNSMVAKRRISETAQLVLKEIYEYMTTGAYGLRFNSPDFNDGVKVRLTPSAMTFNSEKALNVRAGRKVFCYVAITNRDTVAIWAAGVRINIDSLSGFTEDVKKVIHDYHRDIYNMASIKEQSRLAKDI